MRGKVVYCIVPEELADELHELLRHHFRDDESVRVVVERRGTGERRADDRRGEAPAQEAPERERRRARKAAGRRKAERRATEPAVATRPLPPEARRYADRLSFVARGQPATQVAEDADTVRLVVAAQAGDKSAVESIYMRYFDSIYSYLRLGLRDPYEAEDVTQRVFVNVLEALPRYEIRPGIPFRAWLFRIARRELLRRAETARRQDVRPPEEIGRLRDAAGESAEASALQWVTDDDLAILIERMPESQRQALVLRFVVGLDAASAAEALDSTPEAVRQLQHRGLRSLERQLHALGRAPKQGGSRMAMTRRPPPLPVLHARRFALWRM